MTDITDTPAFPCEMPGPGHGKAGPSRIVYPGMYLRDYFAAAALQSFRLPNDYGNNFRNIETAERAYALADAMLEERNK